MLSFNDYEILSWVYYNRCVFIDSQACEMQRNIGIITFKLLPDVYGSVVVTT